LGNKHLKLDSPEWERMLTEWLKRIDARLAELGVDRKHWAFYPIDEPAHGVKAENFSRIGALAKRVMPEVLVYADTTTCEREVLETWKGLVDIWCPNNRQLDKAPEIIPWYRAERAAGRQVWSYVCSGPAKMLSPYSYYRMQAWLALDRGQTGIGHWAYADVGWGATGNAWDDLDASGADYSVVYRGEHAPVSSRRWEQISEGVEDYWLVHSLRQACADAPPKRRQAAKDALALCEQAIRDVVDHRDDTTRIAAHRDLLIQAYEKVIAE
ncbi:MAG: DUF4091 domain-containing protein, partial [Lentisphaeria bacterium]|nr:DUF4091 domain-containing protein [Lentisphaeria bacterium]